MTTPPLPSTPVLMTALAVLFRATWAQRQPDIQPGQAFWARYADSAGLIAGNQARLWQAGDPPAPAPQVPWSVHGVGGFAAGTSNAAH